MNMIQRIKKAWGRIRTMYRVQGLVPTIRLYSVKIAPIRFFLKLFSRRLLMPVKIMNNTMYLDLEDPGISSRLLVEGIREIGHLNQIRGNIKPGMRGIDLGANIGYYALIEAELVGKTGRIHAIEPGPDNVELLKKNLKANNADDIFTVSQYLIGDHDGTEKFYLSACSNRHSMSNVDKVGSIEVPMLTLDSFMEKKGIKPEDIDFLRMDIEGYEVMAFQGMQKILNAKTPFKIFMEFHPRYYAQWGWSFEKLLDFLASHGFKVRGLSYERGTEIKAFTDPSREQILATQNTKGSNGSQAYLERV